MILPLLMVSLLLFSSSWCCCFWIFCGVVTTSTATDCHFPSSFRWMLAPLVLTAVVAPCPIFITSDFSFSALSVVTSTDHHSACKCFQLVVDEPVIVASSCQIYHSHFPICTGMANTSTNQTPHSQWQLMTDYSCGVSAAKTNKN